MTVAVSLILGFFALLLFAYVLSIVLLFQQQRKRVAQEPCSSLLVYASQSGHTQAYAEQTLQQLHVKYPEYRVLNIQDLQAVHLQQAKQIIWMVSTYGEGDAPDTAQLFTQQFLTHNFDLSHLQCAVLAVGDQNYAQFCDFGQRLFVWLAQQKAQMAFDLVTVDQWSVDDVSHWENQLAHWTHTPIKIQQKMKQWQPLTLRSRQCLNEGSQGTGLYHLQFESNDQVSWQTGDILEIQCVNTTAMLTAFAQQYPQMKAEHIAQLSDKNLRNLPLKHDDEIFQSWLDRFETLALREYSIASLMCQQHLDLVVRQEITEGELGLGSGLLTQHLQLGEALNVYVRSHPSFHLSNRNVPMIFIGNGSGIAGLMGHLYQRQAWGFQRNWLIYGERQQQYDAIFSEQFADLKQLGFLEQHHFVYSRDQQTLRYVQDVLYSEAETVKTWIAAGAYIYVCGRLKGMGEAVDAALHDILGAETLQHLRQSKRYRRDVY